MKIIFIASTFYIIYLMRYPYKKTYSKDEDTFPRPLLFLVVPCAALSFLFTASYRVTEVQQQPSFSHNHNW
jgi:ER lumen protein retaining receptor